MNAHTLRCLGAAMISGGLLVLTTSACSGPTPDNRTAYTVPNSYNNSFKNVADMLGLRCGTLDCHGSIARSLVIYSWKGLRYDPTDVPGAKRTAQGTTDTEYQRTYQSVLALEPEIMGNVIFNHGDPTQLTIVRKARGTEAHKGHKVLPTGSPGDRCLISWLVGKPDANACKQGKVIPGTPKPFQGL